MNRKLMLALPVTLWIGTASVRGDALTVGPGGMHSAVQAAVDDAIERGGPQEIHIAAGTYIEPVLLSAVVSHLELSGGWTNGFSNRLDDPSITVISGGDTTRVFDLGATTGHIRISNLTISNGFQDFRGAGLQVSCGDCVVELVNLSLHNNTINSATDKNLIAGGSAVDATILGAGRFIIDHCEMRDNQVTTNRATARGTVRLNLLNSAIGEINNSVIADNLIQSIGDGAVQGGGLYLLPQGHSSARVHNSAFLNNTVQAAASSSSGGGIHLDAFQNAVFDVRGNEIRGNASADTTGQSTAPGALIRAREQARGHFSDNRILANESLGPGVTLASGASITALGNSVMVVERNLWLDNIVTGGPRRGEQLSLLTADSSRLIFRDCVIAGGNGAGVTPTAFETSALHMANLTVTGNTLAPVTSGSIPTPDGSMSVFNSIFFDNGSDLEVDDGVETGNNLVDVDPLFVDAAGQDYRLQPGSPAIDAGTNTPPGGLGGADPDWNLRIRGSSVDAGAYEVSDGPGRVQFLTQMGDGRIGDIVLDTAIDVANVGSRGVESVIISFFDSAAEPWEIEVQDQGLTSFVAASLAPGESATFRTSGRGNIQSGYARLESGSNIGGTGIFTRTDRPSGIELYQAGVPLSEGFDSATLFVDSLGHLETGVTMVNVSESGVGPAEPGEEQQVQLRLYDQEFNLVEEAIRPLDPGRHEALFVSQLFPESVQTQEMQGVLTIEAQNDAEVALVTLRQNDVPALEFPDEVPTLAAFPVLSGGVVPAGTIPIVFYLAQVGNGQQGSIGLQTSLNFTNLSAVGNNVHVDFFQSSGAPMVLTLEGFGVDSGFDFFLKSGESMVAQTDGLGGITAGYARVSTFAGIGGSSVFSQVNVPNGVLEAESGVPASVPLTAFSIFVDTLGDSDTGLALVNPGPAPVGTGGTATIELTLFDAQGLQLNQQALALGAGQHTARFVSQLFSDVDQIGEMRGLVAVSSDLPIAAVTLKQNNNPLLEFPEDVATLTAFPVLEGSPLP